MSQLTILAGIDLARISNCNPTVVSESFLLLLKTVCMKRKMYQDREEAQPDIFDHIETFYGPDRQRSRISGPSPVDLEKQYSMRLSGVEDFAGMADSLHL